LRAVTKIYIMSYQSNKYPDVKEHFLLVFCVDVQ